MTKKFTNTLTKINEGTFLLFPNQHLTNKTEDNNNKK